MQKFCSVPTLSKIFWIIEDASFNSQAPGAQKIADEVVFRRFRGGGVEFFF